MGWRKTSNHWVWILQGVLMGALGFLGNWFKIELFFQVDLLLGSFFVMLAFQFLGVRAGILAGIIASTCTYFLWNHPWAIVIFSVEAIFVAIMVTRRKALLFFADVLFWLTLGWPLVFLFYKFIMNMQAEGVILVALKQCVNGMTNALLVSLVYYFLPWRRGHVTGRHFHRALFLVMAAMVMIPALVATTIFARSYRAEEELRLADTVLHWSQIEGAEIANWSAQQLQTVKALAQTLGDPGSEPQSTLQSKLERVHGVLSSYVRMGAFGPEAKAVAYSPKFDALGKLNIGMDVSDRSYIPRLRQSLVPLVSEVMPSKADSHAPVLAFLAPVWVGGRFRGFYSAVYADSWLANFRKYASREGNVEQTLLDSSGRVIYSTRPDLKLMSFYSRSFGASERRLANGVIHWIPKLEPGVSVMQRWKTSLFVSEYIFDSALGWRLITEVSLAPLLHQLTASTVRSLAFLILLLVLVFLLSYLFSSAFVREIRQLETATREIPDRVKLGGECTFPLSNFEEIRALVLNFRLMLDSLRSAFREHTASVAKEHALMREKELIIKDLHDGLGGIVTNIAMLGEYGVSVREDSVRVTVLRQIGALAREAGVEVRSFMNSAFGGDSGWGDLLAELKDYSAMMLHPHGIEVKFNSEIAPDLPPPGVFLYCNVMRIGREAVANVVKHASAKRLDVVFRVSATGFELDLRDDGVGFESDRVRKRGIANMFARAHDVGGMLSVVGDKGGLVRLSIDFERK
jgi:signal transduction histidine kinase